MSFGGKGKTDKNKTDKNKPQGIRKSVAKKDPAAVRKLKDRKKALEAKKDAATREELEELKLLNQEIQDIEMTDAPPPEEDPETGLEGDQQGPEQPHVPQQQEVPTPPQQGLPTPPQQEVPTPQQQGVPTPPQEGVPTPQQQGVPTPPQEGVPTPPQEGVPTPQQQGLPQEPQLRNQPPAQEQDTHMGGGEDTHMGGGEITLSELEPAELGVFGPPGAPSPGKGLAWGWINKLKSVYHLVFYGIPTHFTWRFELARDCNAPKCTRTEGPEAWRNLGVKNAEEWRRFHITLPHSTTRKYGPGSRFTISWLAYILPDCEDPLSLLRPHGKSLRTARYPQGVAGLLWDDNNGKILTIEAASEAKKLRGGKHIIDQVCFDILTKQETRYATWWEKNPTEGPPPYVAPWYGRRIADPGGVPNATGSAEPAVVPVISSNEAPSVQSRTDRSTAPAASEGPVTSIPGKSSTAMESTNGTGKGSVSDDQYTEFKRGWCKDNKADFNNMSFKDHGACFSCFERFKAQMGM